MNTKVMTIIAAILMITSNINAQENLSNRIPMLGEGCPTFEAQSTLGKINFPHDYFGKWKILFSHPSDFTPVCTSEILELAAMQDIFENMKTKLVVIVMGESTLLLLHFHGPDHLLA